MPIMDWVWPITALYAGPLAVWLYWKFGRRSSPEVTAQNSGKTEQRPFWATVAIGATHCGAGCTVGDIVAESTIFSAGITVGGSVLGADTLSLTAFEVGLFGWMAIMNRMLFSPHLQPNQPTYWFMMQIGMLIGYATSYPMNWWLIRRGIKEAM